MLFRSTTDSKDTITITKLEAVYPSQTVTGVLLDATKAYMSTQGKGNFTFKILKNGAKADDVNDIDGIDDLTASSSKTDTTDLDAETHRTRLTGPGAKVARMAKEPDYSASTLGREKRRR
mgnify:FL=1